MRALVIGGAGYIGSHVVLALCDRNIEVTVFDNLSTGKRENLDERAHFTRGDILLQTDLERVFQAGKFDIVFHFAALKAPEESMLLPGKYARNNITGSLSILDAMDKYNVRNIVFSSSCAVYGESRYIPIDEKHPLKPINYYGYTKLVIEENLSWYARLGKINYAALRYFNAAGYDLDGRIRGREQNPTNLLPIIMETANGERPSMEVFGTDYETEDGSCIRDYIHVNDLAEAHFQAMQYIMGGQKTLITNLATGKGYSVLEVIESAAKITGRAIAYHRADRREGDPAVVVAGTDRALETLGWQAKYSDIDTILKSMWKVYKH
ncbi:MAG: UDP-glucose 4-epimerase GalE [FCB group bacterium]|nr:UDP-glucose 4-epimerase GalE [FCB group bacterium]